MNYREIVATCVNGIDRFVYLVCRFVSLLFSFGLMWAFLPLIAADEIKNFEQWISFLRGSNYYTLVVLFAAIYVLIEIMMGVLSRPKRSQTFRFSAASASTSFAIRKPLPNQNHEGFDKAVGESRGT
jgi:hypothetical protein